MPFNILIDTCNLNFFIDIIIFIRENVQKDIELYHVYSSGKVYIVMNYLQFYDRWRGQ